MLGGVAASAFASFDVGTVARSAYVEPTIIRTPLARQRGIITPTAATFVRDHAGVPTIDPRRHRLVVHGLVRTALSFTLADLHKFPAVKRTYVLECAGNSGSEWQGPSASDVTGSHGLVSCCSWTGARVRDVLDEVGVAAEAAWVLAEGADAARYDRSIPLAKVLDDALLVYGQNGAALRPQNGGPLRLVLPGYEGSTNVKWLRRLKIGTTPWYTREETAEYTELLPSGRARAFDFVMNAKSVIVSPSGGERLEAPGTRTLRGFAWSGRGTIARVDVSTDGGRTWYAARLREPILSRAFTAFEAPFTWDGQPMTLRSRATDETGYVQPTHARLVAARGFFSQYHNNAIHVWHVARNGAVINGA
ncbi:MAG: sulfite dehydrogenase [Vulcanimicrobiaceae bacterium]